MQHTTNADHLTNERQTMKTLAELEAESLDGFKNPERTPVKEDTKTLAELEAESTDGFKNDTTPKTN
jgi:hypothetical protein